MGIKVTIANLFNLLVPSSVATINNNTNKLADEFDKVVYRDGSFNMRGALDMNGNRVINSGTPIDDNDLATYAQVKEITRGPAGNPGGNIGAIGPKTAATGIVIPTGVTMVRTSCYSTPGDGGQADYSLIGADNAQLPASAKFVDSLGRWWAISVQGAVQIEQFGGRCDCPYNFFEYGTTGFTGNYAAPTAGTVTDNLQPYYDAEHTVNVSPNVTQRSDTGSQIAVEFKRNFDTFKCYYFSGTIIPQWSPNIRGNNSGGDSIKTGTTFRFPPDTPGIKLNIGSQQPAGYTPRSVGYGTVHGIWFQGAGGTNRSAHGLQHNIPLRLENCVFDSFAGHNILNIGSVAEGYANTDNRYGLTSGSHYNNVTCRAAGMWNTWITGSDVSASQFDTLQHKGSRLGGLWDSGYFANTYNNYGNHGHGQGFLGSVKYNGRRYALISPATNIGATTTPGTNDRVWEDYGPDDGSTSAYWPTWSSSGTYLVSVPSFISASSTVLDCYIENYYLKQVGGIGAGTAFNGRYMLGRGDDPATGFEALYNHNLGTRYVVPPSDPTYSKLGSTVETRWWGGKGQPDIIQSWTKAKGQMWTKQYAAGGTIRVGLGFEGSGDIATHYYLDRDTNVTLGRATPQPGKIVFTNFALSDVNGTASGRSWEAFSGPVPSATGRANGEMLFKIDPSVGGTSVYTVVNGATYPVGIVGATQATGITTSSTLVDLINALKASKQIS